MGLLSFLFGAKKTDQPAAYPPSNPGESDADRKWRALNLEGIQHAKDHQMGLYRNTRLDMAQFLMKEGRLRDAFNHLLEVNYLDLNGPTNSGSKRWDRSDVFLAPKVLEWTAETAHKLGLDLEGIERTFLALAQRHMEALKAPVAPEKAWSKLRSPLAEQLATIAKAETERQEKEAAREAKRAEKEAQKIAVKEAKAQERADKQAAKLEAKAGAPKRAKKAAPSSDQPPLFEHGDDHQEG